MIWRLSCVRTTPRLPTESSSLFYWWVPDQTFLDPWQENAWGRNVDVNTQVISLTERSYPLVETTISKNWIIYKLPSRELTYPLPTHFSRWFYISRLVGYVIVPWRFFLCKFGGEMTSRSFKSNPNHIEAFQIHAVNLRLSSSLIKIIYLTNLGSKKRDMKVEGIRGRGPIFHLGVV